MPVTATRAAAIPRPTHQSGVTRHRAAREQQQRHRAATFAIPDHNAPSLAALAVHPVEAARRIPMGVALAVASLVLLSGALLAGAARVVAR